MNAPETAWHEFARRYLVARYETGGVIIDLQSGNYFRVNRTAALACDALVGSADRNGAVTRVASELRIRMEDATQIIEQVASALNAPVHQGDLQGSYHFFPSDAGYELRHGMHRVLEISGDGAEVRIARDAPPAAAGQLELYVRALAPKLLFQNEVSVFHASSCVAGGKLIAFAGVSRAGKTTTVRAFAEAGAALVSEDLMVLASGDGPAIVLREGEPRVHDWARTLTTQLLRSPDRATSTGDLIATVVRGPTIALDSILFMDTRRRAGTEFRAEPLDPADALAELLRHDFLGRGDAAAWRRFFHHAVALLGRVDARTMWAPDGVDGLVAAADRYISRTAS